MIPLKRLGRKWLTYQMADSESSRYVNISMDSNVYITSINDSLRPLQRLTSFVWLTISGLNMLPTIGPSSPHPHI